MATTTTLLNLRKAGTGDFVDVLADLDNNWDTIDARVAIKNLANAFTGNNTFAGTSIFNGVSTFNAITSFASALRPVGAGTLQIQDTGGFSLAEFFARTDVAASSTALKLFWREAGGTFRYDSVTVAAIDTGGAGHRALVVVN
jgi:hypothetical protein